MLTSVVAAGLLGATLLAVPGAVGGEGPARAAGGGSGSAAQAALDESGG
jgi:hypothetical protein